MSQTMHEEFIKYLKSYKANQVIIEEGEKNEDFFCLLKGTVEIWKEDEEENGQRVKVGELTEKGTYFGEMSSLLGEIRSASILSKEAVKVLQFPGEMLPQMIVNQPKLGLKLCTTLANRLKGTTEQQRDIAKHRNELREDATTQTLHAKEQYQKLFVMLTALQTKMQNPDLKSIIEYMSHDKLLQGGKKVRINQAFLADVPETLIEPIKAAYADKVTTT